MLFVETTKYFFIYFSDDCKYFIQNVTTLRYLSRLAMGIARRVVTFWVIFV